MSNNSFIRLARRLRQALAEASRDMHLQVGDPIEVLNRINPVSREGRD